MTTNIDLRARLVGLAASRVRNDVLRLGHELGLTERGWLIVGARTANWQQLVTLLGKNMLRPAEYQPVNVADSSCDDSVMTNHAAGMSSEVFASATVDALTALNPSAVGLLRLVKDMSWISQALGEFMRHAVRDSAFAEEIVSGPGLPHRFRPVSPVTQLQRLIQAFPGKDYPEIAVGIEKSYEYLMNVLPNRELPEGTDGWLAIIRPELLGKTTLQALNQIGNAIESKRKFMNALTHFMGNVIQDRETSLLTESAQLGMELATEGQEGSVVFIPCAIGHLRHTSPRRAMSQELPNEFGLGSVAVGCLLITNPEMLGEEKLVLTCLGERCTNDGYHVDDVPVYRYDGDKVIYESTPTSRSKVLFHVLHVTGFIAL